MFQSTPPVLLLDQPAQALQAVDEITEMFGDVDGRGYRHPLPDVASPADAHRHQASLVFDVVEVNRDVAVDDDIPAVCVCWAVVVDGEVTAADCTRQVDIVGPGPSIDGDGS